MMRLSVFATACCLSFAAAFVYMSQVVRVEGPILSTMYTYGLAGLFFIALTLANGRSQTFKIAKRHPMLTLQTAGTTFANVFLAYFVLQHISAFAYAVLFFGTMPSMFVLLSPAPLRGQNKLELLGGCFAVLAGRLVIDAPTPMADIMVCLTVFSSFVGALYMRVTHSWHKHHGVTTLELMAVRFVPTVAICALFAASKGIALAVSFDTMLSFGAIALINTIIPLYLLQEIIRLGGGNMAARVTAFIPILCLVLIALAGTDPVGLRHAIVAILCTCVMLISAYKLRQGQSRPTESQT